MSGMAAHPTHVYAHEWGGGLKKVGVGGEEKGEGKNKFKIIQYC